MYCGNWLIKLVLNNNITVKIIKMTNIEIHTRTYINNFIKILYCSLQSILLMSQVSFTTKGIMEGTL